MSPNPHQDKNVYSCYISPLASKWKKYNNNEPSNAHLADILIGYNGASHFFPIDRTRPVSGEANEDYEMKEWLMLATGQRMSQVDVTYQSVTE